MLRVFARRSTSNSIASTGEQRIQHLAQYPGALQILFRNEQLFLPRARALNIDGREDTLIDQLAVENDFHVARAFELFEDHFIHPRARIDKRRRDDGEGAALFDVAGGTEETLRALQRIRVHTA